MPRGGPFAQGEGVAPSPLPHGKPRDRFCGPFSIATVPKCGAAVARPHTASGSLFHSMGSRSHKAARASRLMLYTLFTE